MLEADFSTARYSALIFISLAGLELPLLESGVSLLIKGFSLCFFFHVLYFFPLSDCQHPGQPRCHPEPQVGA